jgi:glycosyltransferase involved in cell wall biosynthesis
MPNLIHWTINTRSRENLRSKGVNAEVIHDTMDFEQDLEPDERLKSRTSLRQIYGIKAHDLVLLAGTRIVPNKQLELAGYLTAALKSLCQELSGKTLYNGEIFSDRSQIILVIAGRPEKTFTEYRDKVFNLYTNLEISWRYIGDIVRSFCSEKEGLYALYPDVYTMADVVLYPTGWEGFGNQLLEAIASKLPVVVFQYPVFKEDIAPKGVKFISLGDTVLPKSNPMALTELPSDVLMKAAHEIIEIMTDSEKMCSITEYNISLVKKFFSFDVLKAHLQEVLKWAGSRSV